MRAAVLEGPKKMTIKDVPEPQPSKGEVVIKVQVCGICGSDLFLYGKGFRKLHRIIGHEFSGDIVSIGEGVEGWKTGDPGRRRADAGVLEVPVLYETRI